MSAEKKTLCETLSLFIKWMFRLDRSSSAAYGHGKNDSVVNASVLQSCMLITGLLVR